MSRPIIEVEGLSKKYQLGVVGSTTLRDELARWFRPRPADTVEAKEFWALRDVSFQVSGGDVLGIVGRNGAGKSTLLKVLSRVTEPTCGRAILRGRVSSLLEVGTGFHPDLTGRENVFLNGAILGMKRAEISRRFDEIVAFAEVERFIDTPVKHYSSGMYVRLAFAVAAHLEPEILIVDEVLAVGDAEFQKKCLGKISHVASGGRTVFFVSHNESAVRSLCSHALLLEKGRNVAFGDAGTVLDTYLRRGARQADDVCWQDRATAPGNEHVRLHRVRVVLPDAAAVLKVDTAFDLEISYWNNLPGVQNVSLVLNTLGGLCVLNTYASAMTVPAGLITATCRIPANLLSDETYQIDVLVVKDSTNVLYLHREALTFTVADSKRDSAWHGKHIGIVRPKFEWTMAARPA